MALTTYPRLMQGEMIMPAFSLSDRTVKLWKAPQTPNNLVKNACEPFTIFNKKNILKSARLRKL
eukprot:CAMPEP_0113936882 /NCGR_PEP_ID=MMETSP1339-20121228/3639_1 /TAXON_ID=94617 /ORGANISM="Fibrocapsa japonica" /LENGTH=63 /DNA_ID=CAMNT_0000939451 /DNA_START=208 /DNA_END=399 /DNA_ORIENTATION=- /assembly_acc=CAM_ASM_000762